MPIRPDQRELYPANWKAISQRIRERAGNCCEQCGAPNGVYITRSLIDPERWAMDDPLTGGCRTDDGHLYKWSEAPEEFAAQDKMVKVVLTVAHFPDPSPDNVADENLHCWCQLHHLRADAKYHASNASRTRSRKKAEAAQDAGQGELF